MFNIIGFHYTREAEEDVKHNNDNHSVDNITKEEVMKLYSRAKSKEQEEKEAIFEERCILNGENILEDLTPRDLRILIKSEEELLQSKEFSRIFPSMEYEQ